MTYVYDFCGLCAECETVKISFFDVDKKDLVATVVLNDAKNSCKALSAVCGYGYVDYVYTRGDMICVKASVHKSDM